MSGAHTGEERIHSIALDIVAGRADWSLPEDRALFSRETLIEASFAFAAEQNAALLKALEAAHALLQKAADQFAFYADEHAKKHTPDGDAKGATNMAWARSLAQTAVTARAAINLATKEVERS